jgi:hypothetical protein
LLLSLQAVFSYPRKEHCHMEETTASIGNDAAEALREGLFGGKSFNSVWDAPDSENGTQFYSSSRQAA